MLSLLRTQGFMPLTAMVFLNAFIDLGHKITIQNTIFKLYDGNHQIILTAIVNAFILLPYIALFRPAGKTADRFSKARVLRFTSASVVLIMLAISACYYWGWFWPAFFLTLLLALQAAFYGPAKLGYLKELVSNEQLQKANGIVQSVLMVAILSGILVFSVLFERYFHAGLTTPTQVIQTMTPLALILTLLALGEFALSWRLPNTFAQTAQVLPQKFSVLLRSPSLLPVMIGLSVFWSVGQMVLAVYPSFAKDSMGIDNAAQVQAILAMIAIGILLGSLLDSCFSKHFIELKLLPVASLAVMIISFILPFNTSPTAAFILFLLMGITGGLMVVPLNALLQFCSDRRHLGDTIAGANLLQNIAMLSCLIATVAFSFLAIDASHLLLIIGVITLAGQSLMLYLMPHSLLCLRHPAPAVAGFNQLVGYGAVVFIVEQSDKALRQAIQHSYPRPILSACPEIWDNNSVCIVPEQQWSALCPDTLDITLYRARFEQGQLLYSPWQA